MIRTAQILVAALATLVLTAALVLPSTAAATEVRVRPPLNEEAVEEGKVGMVVPYIGTHGAVPEYRLRHGYEELWSIAKRICDQAEKQSEAAYPNGHFVGFQGHPEEAFTGFSALVTRFNEARSPLVPLMRHYGLGYPPDLEDFSEHPFLEVKYSPRYESKRGAYLEEVQALPCRFELTT